MKHDEMNQGGLNHERTNQAPVRQDIEPPDFWRSRYAIGLVVLGAVAMYFLLSEHRAHFFYALPYLLLLACPLMHVFMHHGHGGHAGGHQGDERDANEKNETGPMQSSKPGDQP